jgi:major membrane immunogen (membrane-anchored lipoprotein)
MKRLGYSVLIVCLAITWLLPACGNEEVTSKTPAEGRYAEQLEDKEITENPSKQKR